MIIAIAERLRARTNEVGLRRLAPLALSLAATALSVGCSVEPVVPAGSPPIARVWASRCGACHTPVEPGTRTKSHLDEALGRHKSRVALSDAEWTELREFLAGATVETVAAGPVEGTVRTSAR